MIKSHFNAFNKSRATIYRWTPNKHNICKKFAEGVKSAIFCTSVNFNRRFSFKWPKEQKGLLPPTLRKVHGILAKFLWNANGILRVIWLWGLMGLEREDLFIKIPIYTPYQSHRKVLHFHKLHATSHLGFPCYFPCKWVTQSENFLMHQYHSLALQLNSSMRCRVMRKPARWEYGQLNYHPMTTPWLWRRQQLFVSLIERLKPKSGIDRWVLKQFHFKIIISFHLTLILDLLLN